MKTFVTVKPDHWPFDLRPNEEAAESCAAGRSHRRRSHGKRPRAERSTQVKQTKVFWFFFSKKNSLLFEKRSTNFYPICPED
jgi:hypothetical protein